MQYIHMVLCIKVQNNWLYPGNCFQLAFSFDNLCFCFRPEDPFNCFELDQNHRITRGGYHLVHPPPLLLLKQVPYHRFIFHFSDTVFLGWRSMFLSGTGCMRRYLSFSGCYFNIRSFWRHYPMYILRPP